MSHAPMNHMRVKETLARRAGQVERHLASLLDESPATDAGRGADGALHASIIPERLRDAMRYSLLAGGKRLRPVLCLSSAALCGLDAERILPFAAALECIHTYSLIHDDLPAMDDDDLRRGRPSCHKAFDEATAILAGDALLTDAFALMASVGTASPSPIPPDRVLAAVAEAARAAGSSGMVGGQIMDMDCTGKTDVPPETLCRLDALKTGALFRAACSTGAILAGADADAVTALRGYGEALGAAFQIVDDILDATADTATLGKPAGSDADMGKATYPAILGLEQSRELAREAALTAVGRIDHFDASPLPGTGEEAAFLKGLALVLLDRVK